MFDSKSLLFSTSIIAAFLFASLSGHSSAKTLILQAPQVQCETGFSKTDQVKGADGMTLKMVCKSPVITCPKVSQPGWTTSLVPKIKNIGIADGQQQFRFVYTCKSYKVAG